MSRATIRALVVDDEQPARERLARLLRAFEEIEVVGEADDGERATELILELAPDVVFLDIQMPGCSGMEVVASLPSPRPKIVFCTAFDQYAVDAFELHAVDYLLKPINPARLAGAVERVREGSGGQTERVLAGAGGGAIGYPTRFLAKHASRYHVVPADDVLYFAADGGVTRLQTLGRHYWMQPTLGELEQRLDPARFFRISRAAIVNLDAVQEVLPESGGLGQVVVGQGRPLEVARRRFKELMERLGHG